MSTSAVYHSSACASRWRHKHRRPRTQIERGTLAITTPGVAARLLAEGVPPGDIYMVAAEVERCIRLINAAGDDVLSIRLHPWTNELIRRYGDKLVTLTMTTRGRVTP
ncbi:MAG TPA: hypothetical protein VHX14_03740 [Thermoanaerobaculia bacterium]|jgi:hypothetical protein|nr:hypothetical protein [Thermoanaerobaculia bacterium]